MSDRPSDRLSDRLSDPLASLADQISFAHQLGQLEGRINALERKVDAFEQRIETRLGAIEGKLDQVATLLNLGRGGWQAFALLGAMLTAAFSAVGWVVDHVGK